MKLADKNKEKKPHNIRIKNNNPNEPKIKPDTRYSEKQKYRLYKTKIEPNKHDKIMIHDADDIVAKIREAFNKEKPFAGIQIEYCIAGKEYMNKSNYTAYDLYFPKYRRTSLSL